jgi:hypothetical protein
VVDDQSTAKLNIIEKKVLLQGYTPAERAAKMDGK